MNKKGFTLIELLAVIVILGIVLTIGTVSVISVKKRIDKNLYGDKLKLMVESATLWGQDNKYELTGGTVEQKLIDLINSEYYRDEELLARYDVDGDGKVTADDVIPLRTALALSEGGKEVDVNGDGVFDAKDTVRLTKITASCDATDILCVQIKVEIKNNRVYSCIPRSEYTKIEYENERGTEFEKLNIYCD